MSYVTCWCADPDCRANGCKLLRRQRADQWTGAPFGNQASPLPPKGCICPPTSEQTCKAHDCPRKTKPLFPAPKGADDES